MWCSFLVFSTPFLGKQSPTSKDIGMLAVSLINHFLRATQCHVKKVYLDFKSYVLHKSLEVISADPASRSVLALDLEAANLFFTFCILV